MTGYFKGNISVYVWVGLSVNTQLSTDTEHKEL